jgi:hypothetical protein
MTTTRPSQFLMISFFAAAAAIFVVAATPFVNIAASVVA